MTHQLLQLILHFSYCLLLCACCPHVEKCLNYNIYCSNPQDYYYTDTPSYSNLLTIHLVQGEHAFLDIWDKDKCLAQRRSQWISETQCLNRKPLGFKPRPNIMLKIWLEILAKLLFDSSAHLVPLHFHHHHPATTAQTLKPSLLAWQALVPSCREHYGPWCWSPNQQSHLRQTEKKIINTQQHTIYLEYCAQ